MQMGQKRQASCQSAYNVGKRAYKARLPGIYRSAVENRAYRGFKSAVGNRAHPVHRDAGGLSYWGFMVAWF